MLPRWLLWITLLLLARRGQPEPPSPLSVGQELWTVVIHERPARGDSAASTSSTSPSSSPSSAPSPSARHAPRPPRQVLVAIISAYFDQPLVAQDGSAGVAPSEAAPPPRLLCRGLGGPGGAISAHATAARANGSALADDDLDYDHNDGAQYGAQFGAQYADDEGAAAAVAGPRYDADHHLTATRLRLLSLPLAADARVGGVDVDGTDADVVRAFLRQHTSRQSNLRRWALLSKDAFGQVRNGGDDDVGDVGDGDGDGDTSRHKSRFESRPDAAAGVEGLGGVFSANCRCQLDLQSLNLTNVGGERAVARPCLLPQSRLRSHVVHLLRYATSPAVAHATTRLGNGLGNKPGNEGLNSGAATNSSDDGTTTPRAAEALRGGARESLRGGGKVDMLVDIDWDTTDVELAMESYLLSDVSDTGMSHPGASPPPPFYPSSRRRRRGHCSRVGLRPSLRRGRNAGPVLGRDFGRG